MIKRDKNGVVKFRVGTTQKEFYNSVKEAKKKLVEELEETNTTSEGGEILTSYWKNEISNRTLDAVLKYSDSGNKKSKA